MPLSPCLTPVKLPPTYMVEPTWAKAWFGCYLLFTRNRWGFTAHAHEVLAAYCETVPETVEPLRPSSDAGEVCRIEGDARTHVGLGGRERPSGPTCRVGGGGNHRSSWR